MEKKDDLAHGHKRESCFMLAQTQTCAVQHPCVSVRTGMFAACVYLSFFSVCTPPCFPQPNNLLSVYFHLVYFNVTFFLSFVLFLFHILLLDSSYFVISFFSSWAPPSSFRCLSQQNLLTSIKWHNVFQRHLNNHQQLCIIRYLNWTIRVPVKPSSNSRWRWGCLYFHFSGSGVRWTEGTNQIKKKKKSINVTYQTKPSETETNKVTHRHTLLPNSDRWI